jgi:pSer/pThr/pTyr-binding forkhead associated (FHA) protein
MNTLRREGQNFGTDRIAKPVRESAISTQQSPPLATLVNETTGQIHPLLAETTTIGRDKSCVIMIREDGAVSRKHAQVLRRGVSFVIEDLGSANGVLVNGQRVSGPHQLQVGDRVGIGGALFVFKRRA